MTRTTRETTSTTPLKKNRDLDENTFLKKKSKKIKQAPEAEPPNNDDESSKTSKMKKKKNRDLDKHEKSETSSEVENPVEKKNKVRESDDSDTVRVSKLSISTKLRKTLKREGLKTFFHSQAKTIDTICKGQDLVGLVPTGSVMAEEKTLTVVLAISESLTKAKAKTSEKTGHAKAPSVLVIVPTRDLVNKIAAYFEIYGGALGLTSSCLYFGSAYWDEAKALKSSVDIVIGTPGRIRVHVLKGTMEMRSLKFRVLDDVDEMLRMGFAEDIEFILDFVDATKAQTLFFSATLPSEQDDIASRFLKSGYITYAFLGKEKIKPSENVKHIVVPCAETAMSNLIPDIICCYSSADRTIIFNKGTDSASEIAGVLCNACVLTGNLKQAEREVTLNWFRSGKIMILVTTSVDAWGLDINDAQLIIQCGPPSDIQAYVPLFWAYRQSRDYWGCCIDVRSSVMPHF